MCAVQWYSIYIAHQYVVVGWHPGNWCLGKSDQWPENSGWPSLLPSHINFTLFYERLSMKTTYRISCQGLFRFSSDLKGRGGGTRRGCCLPSLRAVRTRCTYSQRTISYVSFLGDENKESRKSSRVTWLKCYQRSNIYGCFPPFQLPDGSFGTLMILAPTQANICTSWCIRSFKAGIYLLT